MVSVPIIEISAKVPCFTHPHHHESTNQHKVISQFPFRTSALRNRNLQAEEVDEGYITLHAGDGGGVVLPQATAALVLQEQVEEAETPKSVTFPQ